MRKWMTFTSILLLAVIVAIAGCSSNEAGQDQNDQTENNSPENGTGNESNDQVTITLASWAGEVEQKRIEAFEEQFPHIKVEVDESITWPWDESLAAAAAAGTLPDVIWLSNAPPAYQHDWAADLTPFLDADPDYNPELIYGNLAESTNYNGKQIALPHGLYVHGVLINLDLFERENQTVPESDWTLSQARELARNMTRANEGQFGLGGTLGIRDTLIPQFDASQGWATFDGESFNFNSQAFVDAVNTVSDIVRSERVDVNSLSDDERNAEYGEGNDPWNLGKIAMKWGATWDFAGTNENAEFNWDFRPYPAVNAQRTPLVTDYIAISSTSDKKEAAFEFLKWMTFSKEGWLTRIDIEDPIGSVPLINDEEVWSAYLANEHVPSGVRDVIPMIGEGFIDPMKWAPGYMAGMNASLWTEEGGKLITGEVRPEDIGPVWEERANRAAEEAMRAIQ
ncbi:ABC transporter substrate-binding protein [Bacillus horti]|uniref:Multiple sugar transport system substrate-binding protein n=1 Tax=Caldalkalibacillus horti TaxID=77523 RepID=A0ABT9W565_9BACI|nr:extracellular solute-binding protein [Bacillus horti]MDQ0168403.1 multiple sugar transport system substrate-binding protein [Bacillus horti]